MFRKLITPAIAMAVATASTASAQTYLAQQGIVAIQMEESGAPGAWTESTSTPGYTGESYIRWSGDNLFSQPGAQGVFGFNVDLDQSGTWNLRIHNRHEDPDPTEENDVWVRMDGGPWNKLFSNGYASVGAWTWESRFELGHGSYPDASYNLSAGVHRVEFSGRSHGFKIDRLHLFRPGTPGGEDISTPVSPQRFGERYGDANSNSTGAVGVVDAIGFRRASTNLFLLEAKSLPANVPGYFIASRSTDFVANPGGSEGNLLLGGDISRFIRQPAVVASNGSSILRMNLSSIPSPTGTIAISGGETWYFQFWHRDIVNGTSTSNFSRGLAVTFE